ncbi:MAG: hypothetical protein LKJ80_05815 [Oscillibacter sp.]|jgi:hypothetical protein|nr:hypothetical protein [Oscillibacter sp.]
MFGYVEWSQVKKKRNAGERVILHMRFFGVSLLRGQRTPEFVLRLRCASAARRMQKMGVSRAVFPEGFPYLTEFEKCGVRPADPLALYRAMTAELVRFSLEDRGVSPSGAVVAVCGEHLTAELARAVTELCIRNRYVTLCAGGEGEKFCRQLRREYGVSLLRTDDPEQLGKADVLVLFAPRAEPRGGMAILPLYEGGGLPSMTLRLAGERESEVPEGCDRSELFAALYAAGGLKPGQVEICGDPAGN